ncbi:MAG: hypothetical protein ACKVOO_02590 [Burkholderiaceae bacterium]
MNFILPNGISRDTVIMMASISVAGYFYAKQHVWLSLSADGISGRGYTNRRIEISWHYTITVNTVKKSDMDGVEIRTLENDGFVKKQILSLFIPSAIAVTPEFLAAVAKFAPLIIFLKRSLKMLRNTALQRLSAGKLG